MAPSYDSVEGIESYLVDLPGLYKLYGDRREAAYDRKERLSEFLILGRWITDTCGNFMPCELKNKQYELLDPAKLDLPRVVRLRDSSLKVVTNLIAYGVYQTCSYSSPPMPPPGIKCPECERSWSLDNAHDHVIDTENERFPLNEFVGKTFHDLRAALKQHTDAERFAWTRSIRNDKYLESPNANKRGWLREEVPADYVFQEGDEASVDVCYYSHKRCHGIRKRIDSRAEIESILTAAEIGSPYALAEIPNQYCPCDRCPPWWVVSTCFGDLKLGWRKRVMVLDWSETKKDLSRLFENEDVTKDAFQIHCWGTAKTAEHLSKVRDALR